MPNGCGDEVSGYNFITYTRINSDGNSKAHIIMQFKALKIYKRQTKNIREKDFEHAHFNIF